MNKTIRSTHTEIELTANSIFAIYHRMLSDKEFLGKLASKNYNIEDLLVENNYEMYGELKNEFINFVNEIRDLVYGELYQTLNINMEELK